MKPAKPCKPSFWLALTVPKSEAKKEENEDAHSGNPARGLFALADGATQSGFAAQWARLLVEGYTSDTGSQNLSADWLAQRRQAWAEAVDGLEVPWYLVERREQGAYATFLGLSLTVDGSKKKAGLWSLIGIGDTCAFHLRSGELQTAWPIEHSSQFNNSPTLIGSRAAENDRDWQLHAGTCEVGDFFVLMTDALACWFLTQMESVRNPWRWLGPLLESRGAESKFADLVTTLRRTGELKDDDTTLVAIRL